MAITNFVISMIRMQRILNNSIKKFKLNLGGLTVFTEAATGNYAYTPIIAALSNAKKVYALAKDSKYGTKESIKDQLNAMANFFKVQHKIEVVFEKKPEYIFDSDIITNSGFVRPIDKTMIDAMKTTAVIPLMFETWEHRADDIDLDYCKKKNIPVLGTNEQVEPLNLFYCDGFLVTKLLFECGFEVYKNKFLIIGSGIIGKSIQTFFTRNYIESDRITFNRKEKGSHVTYFKNFDIKTLKNTEYDAVIICELIYPENIFGEDGFLNNTIVDFIADIQFIHICGKIDQNYLSNHNCKIYPTDIAPFGYMTRHADYLGPVFTLELNTAGLKVGEIMAKLRLDGCTYTETIKKSLTNDLVMGFNEGQ